MRFFGFVWLGALLAVAPTACVYDGDERCGPHQVLLSADRCACEPGFVPGTAGCIACADNERESNGACVCVDGYARGSEAAVCEAIPQELGGACDPDTSPCTSEDYTLCHVPNDGAGYCTNACSSSADCDGGYLCHEAGADSYCRRPPVGHGDPCKTSANCTGEATFCETIQSHLCLVPCSAGKTDVCFEGEVCCDFVLFNPICVPSNACVPQSGTEVQ